MALQAAYRIRLDAPHRHEVEVEMIVRGDFADPLVVAMPVWNPGSYLVREFARNVVALDASDGAGVALVVEKTRKDRWSIATGGAREVRVHYRLYAHELSVRTSHVDGTHAHLEGPATFLYVPGALEAPATVRVEVPPGWQIECGLGRDADGAFHAGDFDELYDAPMALYAPPSPGTPRPIRAEAAGRPLDVVFWGEARLDGARLAREVSAIVEAAASLYGGTVPYDRYVFLTLLVPGGRGGLEHRNSSTLLVSPYAFERPDAEPYEEMLALFSHEFFHLWNVKRIRPAGLAPYDYGSENYTRLLWLSEGLTAYYDWLILRRAGLVAPEKYLGHVASEIQKLEDTPGRAALSLEEASFDAWIRFYRPDDNAPNAGVSYYTKGDVVAAMMDLEIRARSTGVRSLDDVMRLLWNDYGARGRAVPEREFAAIVQEATGVDAGDLVAAYVRGTAGVDYARHLGRAGLTIARKRRDETASAGGRGGWLGVRTRTEGGRLIVANVLRDTPAERAGLYAGDEIVAIDGSRVDDASLRERLRAWSPGERLIVTAFRRERLTEIAVELGEPPPDEYAVVPLPAASTEQRALYEGWLQAAWPPAPSPAPKPR